MKKIVLAMAFMSAVSLVPTLAQAREKSVDVPCGAAACREPSSDGSQDSTGPAPASVKNEDVEHQDMNDWMPDTGPHFPSHKY